MGNSGKDKFKNRAGSQLGNALSMESLLSDDDEKEAPKSSKDPKAQKLKNVKSPLKPAVKKATQASKQKTPVDKKEATEKVLEHTERQSMYFSRELDDLVYNFMRTHRKKNMNRFVRGILHDFFDKPEKEQIKLYEKILVKHKNKIG